MQKINAEKLRAALRAQGAVLDAGYQPQVRLTWTPERPRPGEKVIFKAIPNAQLRDALKQIQWDFIGNGTVSAEGERVTHLFDAEKVHAVSLLVTDTAGRRRLLAADVPVGIAEPLSKSQATNTPVTIKHAGGTAKITLDQRKETTPFQWVPLGEFECKAGDASFLELRNAGTDGRIAIDGARWRWLGK